MNYLAHLFLSEDTPESRIGNLLGDFIKSPVLDSYPPPMQRGIALHREIDRYTDSHRIFQGSQQRVSTERRRFSGILIDVFYDHFLAVGWSQYSSLPLGDFTQQIYQALLSYHAILPDSLRLILPNMIKEDWLTSYQTLSGIDQALKRISGRIKYENNLASAVNELEQHEEQFKSDFQEFFPNLLLHVQRVIAERSNLNS